MLAAKLLKAENHGIEWEISKNHIRQLHVTEKIRALQLLHVTKGIVVSPCQHIIMVL
jgi:hypothetical protein